MQDWNDLGSYEPFFFAICEDSRIHLFKEHNILNVIWQGIPILRHTVIEMDVKAPDLHYRRLGSYRLVSPIHWSSFSHNDSPLPLWTPWPRVTLRLPAESWKSADLCRAGSHQTACGPPAGSERNGAQRDKSETADFPQKSTVSYIDASSYRFSYI